jgi:tRNA threonylcarbamoyladenosine biosynthesis protein TsaE
MAQARKGKKVSSASDAVEATTASPEETEQLGMRLGAVLWPGAVLALIGKLGGGKTTFMRGLMSGLGGDPEAVRSPTFVLVREYSARVPVVHVDGYRLQGAADAAWLDSDEIFSPSKVTAIEWPERFEDLLPEDRIAVAFEHLSTNRRRIRILATGPISRKGIEPL